MEKIVRTVLICFGSYLFAAANFVHADTLAQIFDLASNNDPEIRSAEAALKANQQSLAINRAALLPQVSAGAQYSDSNTDTQTFVRDDTQNDPLVGSVVDVERESSSTTYSASLGQVLFDLPSWYNYKQGDAIAERAEKDYMLAKQDLIVRTTEAYLNVLSAVDSLATIQAEERAFQSQLDQTQQRYDVGLIAITDVLEAQAAYDDVTSRLIQARGALGIAFEGLSVLTGQNHTSIAPLADTFPVVDPMPKDSDSWVEMALANNYALASSELVRDAALFNSKSSKMEHLPSLNLRLSYADTRPEGDPEIANDAFDSTRTGLTLSLDMPIFTGGRITGQRKQAYYQYVQAEESLNNTRRSLIQTTRNLHLSTVTGVSAVNARAQSIKSSESALEATRAGYEVGTRNLVDVLNAERALYASQLDYFNARYEYILNMLNLKLASGTLTSEDVMYYNQYLDASNQIPRSTLFNTAPAGEPAASQ